MFSKERAVSCGIEQGWLPRGSYGRRGGRAAGQHPRSHAVPRCTQHYPGIPVTRRAEPGHAEDSGGGFLSGLSTGPQLNRVLRAEEIKHRWFMTTKSGTTNRDTLRGKRPGSNFIATRGAVTLIRLSNPPGKVSQSESDAAHVPEKRIRRLPFDSSQAQREGQSARTALPSIFLPGGRGRWSVAALSEVIVTHKGSSPQSFGRPRRPLSRGLIGQGVAHHRGWWLVEVFESARPHRELPATTHHLHSPHPSRRLTRRHRCRFSSALPSASPIAAALRHITTH